KRQGNGEPGLCEDHRAVKKDFYELKEELKQELKKEIREELQHEMRGEFRRENEEESNEEESRQDSDQITSVSRMQTEEKIETTEESVVKQSEDNQEQIEGQKETVAELFGKNSETMMPEITIHKQHSIRGFVLWMITMIAIAVGVSGGLILFTSRSENAIMKFPSGNPKINTSSPIPTPTVQISPTALPSPTVKSVSKKNIKIQVQNGGGVVGAGSKMKSFLEKKGYTVVEVGNAATYTYEETEIIVKASKASIRDMVEEDLAEDYTIGKVETTLSESAPYDVRVIVGKK
ncbi:MAG: LytR C-terminal domain-containing protein, partial [Patescibacteria group bacterium]|nr:LytR C-terminal domain-containing protein [Patescibacteria group bacterium]